MTNIFLSVLEISISVSLVVAALILLAPLLNRRYAVKWKYLIWIFLALRLLIPISGANGQPMTDMLPKINTRTTPEAENSPPVPLPDETVPRRVIVEIPAQMTAPIDMPSGKNNTGITLLDLAAFFWMAGSLVFISVHVISYLYYKRQVMKKGTVISDRQILSQIFELKRELRIKCSIHAVEYSKASSPMVIGFLKPVLVLPKEQYSPEELYFILKHELVHLKRKDVYFKLLFAAANAVHWFNPLIWILKKEAAIDMELSCDERVTQGATYEVRKAYTETLLATLHKQCTKSALLSTHFYGGKRIMKKRFKNILRKTSKKNGISVLLCAVILTLSLGTLAGCQVAKGHTLTDDSQENKNSPSVNVPDRIEQMAGRWMIDLDVTGKEKAQELWGTGFSYGNGMEIAETEDLSGYLGTADRQEIRNIVDEFASAYFGGDADTIQKFLVSNYEWKINTYEGTGTISDMTVKGLSDADEQRASNGTYVVSLEFRDSDQEDRFQYLTFTFSRKEDGWKILFYGLEG